MAGIKNIEEVAKLVELIAVEICKGVKKDGFQVNDLVSFIQAPEFEEALRLAVEGMDQLPEEASDIGLIEGITLARDLQKIFASIQSALKVPA